MSYARTGSPLPEAFHGIYWMDQRGRNVGRATTGSGYRQEGSVAADEFVVAFGDASWDAGRRCVTSVPVFGGQKGHWTWADQDGSLDNQFYNLNCGIQLAFDFCCKDRNCNEIDILGHVNAQDTLEYLASPDFHGLGWAGSLLMGPILWGLHWWNGHSEIFWLPTDAQSWHMIKKPWGYDRLTVMCSSCWSWLQTRYHYPLFQIVDGNGHRTQHYEAYLQFANQDTHAGSSSFAHPMNRGNGTSFVGRAHR
uniref:Uncharacterized protein n=1 Tax=Alexandrium catenella TaxID=2925 RepID=A0A7S1LCF2_ALECA